MGFDPGKLTGAVTEKRCILILALLFLLVSGAVALTPYEPMDDLADATTNAIWADHYADGTYHIPYDEWTYGQTQSVVVEYHGEYVVVNEKGPGHVFLLLPFHAAGLDPLFGPAMLFLALLGTYMLGRRLFDWRTGFIASMLLLFSPVVIVMCHRSYWTDASTMHLLVLGFWLMVEANYRYNGGSLDPGLRADATPRERYLAIGIMALSGLAFGASVSTRYPTALTLFAFLAYLGGFYLLRAWPGLKRRDWRGTLRTLAPAVVLLLAFVLGLLAVLVPLCHYNAEYFGGPFRSGYDATPLADFIRTGTLVQRNTTATWTSGTASYISTALGNMAKLLPVFIARMPALLFAPLGIYCLRRRKPELAVLLLWVGINWFTYLSLDWVTMYAHPHLVPWEPRYWLPSLPPICLLGGLGMYRLADRLTGILARKILLAGHERKAARILVTGALAGAMMLWGAVPAVHYLEDPNAQMRIPGAPAREVTTDQLLFQPGEYLDSPVRVMHADIVGVTQDGIAIRSQNHTAQGAVEVRFVDWPPGTLPGFRVGQVVDVQGMFLRSPAPPDMPPYSIHVKYGTQDLVRLVHSP